MTDPRPTGEVTLEQLVGLSDKARLAAVNAMAHPAEELCRFGEATEKLAHTDVAAAVAASAALEATAKSLGNPKALARVRRARILALCSSGAFEDALALSQVSRVDAVAAGESIEAARALIAQMQPLLVRGRAEEALAAGSTARDELLALDEPILAARVEINLGNINRAIGQPERALACLDSAASVLATQPDLAANIANARGESLLLLDRFGEARQAFTSALAQYAPQGGLHAAITEGNIADVAARQGLYQESLERFAHARAQLGDAPSGHAARMLVEEGEVFEMLGVADVSGERFAKGLAEFDRLGMAYEALRASLGQARALAFAGEAATSATCFGAAADRAQSLGNEAERSRALLQQASALARDGRVGEARKTLGRVAAGSLNAPLDRVMVHFHASVVAEREGVLATAMSEIDCALEHAAVAQVAPVQAEALTQRAYLLRRTARPMDAIRDARRAVSLVEHMRGTLRAERTRSGLLGRRLGAYEELVASLIADGSPDSLNEAFRVAEQAKSRALLDRMRQAIDEPRQSGNGPRSEELRSLRAKLDSVYSRIAGEAGGGLRFGLADSSREEIAVLEAKISAIEAEDLRGGWQSHRSMSQGDVASVAADLPYRTAMVAYYRARGHWMAFVLSAGEAQAVQLGCDDHSLAEAVERVGFQLRQGLVKGTTQSAQRRARLLENAAGALSHLSELIWSPVAHLLSDFRDIVVVPHGILHTVPFHALVQHATNGKIRYVAEDHAIAYAPSAGVWASLTARHRESAGVDQLSVTRVIGVPDETAPCIGDEAKSVASIVGDPHPLIGAEATVATVKKVLAESQTTHLACHGFFLPEAPRASGLKLADGWLTARDIAELPCTPATVVLSGCETAASRVRDGDELLGLAGAFLGNSTTQLVATLWPIHDGTAAEAMTSFHRRRAEPTRKNASGVLRDLSLELLDRHPHPAHWAPFVTIGVSS